MKKVCTPDCIAFQPKSKPGRIFGCVRLDTELNNSISLRGIRLK